MSFLRSRPRSRKWLLVAAAVVVTLVLVEIGLQLYVAFLLPQKMLDTDEGLNSSAAYEEPDVYYGKYAPFPKVNYDTYLEYRPVPGDSGSGYRINTQGFRDDHEIPAEKGDEFRIFITGGSVAYGNGVKQEDLYSQVLEDRLHAAYPGRKFRVVSAGMGAYTSVQERIITENLLLSYSPDLIVMLSGWNDVYAGYTGKEILKYSDYLDYRERLGGEAIRSLQKKRAPRWGEYSVKLLCLIDKVRYNLSYDPEALNAEVAEYHLPPSQVVGTLLRNVHILSDISERYQYKLAFYLQPTLYNTAKPLGDWELARLAQNKERFVGYADYNAHLYDKLRQVLPVDADSNAYSFFDGDRAIRDASEDVFSDHVHLGDRGNRLMGQDLFRCLQEGGLVETEKGEAQLL